MTYTLDDINIKLFKLSSGEEIISLISSTSGNNVIELESPLLLHRKVTVTNHSFAFSDWMALSNEKSKVALNPMHVISSADVDDEIKDRYIRMCLSMRKQEEHDMDDEYEYDDSKLEEYMEKIFRKETIH
jgi:hypothetical protein